MELIYVETETCSSNTSLKNGFKGQRRSPIDIINSSITYMQFKLVGEKQVYQNTYIW